jgi:transcriptional regulator NrdR family protein
MNCPRCGSNQVMVIDSRPRQNETVIKRRQRCSNCFYTFGSVEIYEDEFKKLTGYEKAVKTLENVIMPLMKGETR